MNTNISSTTGLNLHSSTLSEEQSLADVSPKKHIFTLSTGRKACFIEEFIHSELVEDTTFVIQENNVRDQAALTAGSLKDITRTIKFQQFYPAIGVRSGDRIEILDGSRRRASAILCGVGLRILVTEHDITAAEAQRLAKDLQTSIEHNIREIGLRLMRLKNSGMSQKIIAISEEMSQAKVSRALQAAAAPEYLITLFPVQSELTFKDYKALCIVDEELSNKEISVDILMNKISNEIEEILTDTQLAADEVKNFILKAITKGTAQLTEKSKDKSVVTNLWFFDDKDRFARKRVKGRVFSYEFNRLPRHLQDELDGMISDLLKKNLDTEAEK